MRLMSHISVSALLFALIAAGFVSMPTSHAADSEKTSDAPSVLAAPIIWYSYRNYTQIKDALLTIERQHSDICRLFDVGDSWEKTQGTADRDILAVKISDNVLVDEDEPEVLVMALHHAREWSTSELVLELINNITSSYGNDSRISWLVDNREIWVIPIVNPDGLDYSLSVDDMWRKNRRLNYDGTYGVDLNRNYPGSMNNDSAGEWGGAGASHVTTDETYCGEAPFSEPETQAVRDLVQQRDFEIALDFHSYGDWVMWPWGYTTNLTPDNADLVRIGTQLAAVNGYTAAQSVDMYPTTGDSLDWLYGGPWVYPFLFEVGREFHPAKYSDVWDIINKNIPAALLGIEIAGDREERSFSITHNAVATREYNSSGFSVSADVTADRGVDTSALTLHYRVNGSAWNVAVLARSVANDTYVGWVPAAPVGSVVEYYFVARDLGGVEIMSPRYAPYELHSFTVVAGASVGPLEVIFDPPSTMDGSVDNAVGASAKNLTSGSELLLHVRNVSLGMDLVISMAQVSSEGFQCVIPAGTPLGEHELWLTVELGGAVQWTSGITQLHIADAQAPQLWNPVAVQSGANSLTFTVQCSDVYGVEAVTVMLRYQGSADENIVQMNLISGSATNGNWSVTVTVDGTTPVEYRFIAFDGVQWAELPQSPEVLLFVPSVVPEFPRGLVSVAAVSLAALLAVVSRARRL
jgi:hypothetical protein